MSNTHTELPAWMGIAEETILQWIDAHAKRIKSSHQHLIRVDVEASSSRSGEWTVFGSTRRGQFCGTGRTLADAEADLLSQAETPDREIARLRRRLAELEAAP